MNIDEAKAIVLDTCKSTLEMDIAQMRPGLEKRGFTISDFERLDPHTFQQYLVWVDCPHGYELAKKNFESWLMSLSDFPWVGKWDFIIIGAFTVRVTRSPDHVYGVSPWVGKLPWPEHCNETIEAAKWQRPLIEI